MYPKVNIFELEFSSFSLLLFLSFIISSIILQINLKKYSKDNLLFIKILVPIYFFGISFSALFFGFEKYGLKFEDFSLYFKSGKNVLGGFIFAMVYLLIFCRIYKHNIYEFFKYLFPSISIGYAIGRLGCFFAGDGCYGIKTDFFLGMSFPNGVIPTYNDVHPTPLYDFAFFLIMYIFYQCNIKKNYINNRYSLYLFFILSSLERFFIEFIRRNDTYFYFTQSQWISLFILIVIIIIILWNKYEIKN